MGNPLTLGGAEISEYTTVVEGFLVDDKKRLDRFTITCDCCGGSHCDILTNDLGVDVICYNEECSNQEVAISDLWYEN